MRGHQRWHLGRSCHAIHADVVRRHLAEECAAVEVSWGLNTDYLKFFTRFGRIPDPRLFDRLESECRRELQRLDCLPVTMARTDSAEHRQNLEQILRRLWAKDLLAWKDHLSYYCVGHRRDLRHEESRSSGDTVFCIEHDQRAMPVLEQKLFFRLSRFQASLAARATEWPNWIFPRWKTSMTQITWYLNHLTDVALTRRDDSWGIELPLPEPTAERNPSTQRRPVLLDWFSELTLYLTGAGYGHDVERFRQVWPPRVQVIDAALLDRHALIWPALLEALELSQPERLWVHGVVLYEDRKVNRAVRARRGILENSLAAGADPLRYFFSSAGLGSKPVNFYPDTIANTNRGMGRLIGHAIKFIREAATNLDLLTDRHSLPVRPTPKFQEYVDRLIAVRENGHYSRGIGIAREMANSLHLYLDLHSTLLRDRKTPRALAAAVLNAALEQLRCLTCGIAPFLPENAEFLWRQIGLGAETQPGSKARLLAWQDQLVHGATLPAMIGHLPPLAGVQTTLGAALPSLPWEEEIADSRQLPLPSSWRTFCRAETSSRSISHRFGPLLRGVLKSMHRKVTEESRQLGSWVGISTMEVNGRFTEFKGLLGEALTYDRLLTGPFRELRPLYPGLKIVPGFRMRQPRDPNNRNPFADFYLGYFEVFPAIISGIQGIFHCLAEIDAKADGAWIVPTAAEQIDDRQPYWKEDGRFHFQLNDDPTDQPATWRLQFLPNLEQPYWAYVAERHLQPLAQMVPRHQVRTNLRVFAMGVDHQEISTYARSLVLEGWRFHLTPQSALDPETFAWVTRRLASQSEDASVILLPSLRRKGRNFALPSSYQQELERLFFSVRQLPDWVQVSLRPEPGTFMAVPGDPFYYKVRE